MLKIVGYRRVSTKRQEQSGLGLKAQQRAIESYIQEHNARLLAVYTEKKSGKRNDRPGLGKAISHAKRTKSTLVIASLDRLSRDVAFIADLMNSGIDFACCNLPVANRQTINILSAVAEHEIEIMSQQIKASLQAARRRGVHLGNDGKYLTASARVRGRKAAAKANRQRADQAYAVLLPTMQKWRDAGLTQQDIADRLNQQGRTTRRGKPWSQVQVMRCLNRKI